MSDGLRTLVTIAVIHRPSGSRYGQQKSRTADGFNWYHNADLTLESLEIAAAHESVHDVVDGARSQQRGALW